MIDRSEVLYVIAISNLNVTGILLPLIVHNRRCTNFFDESSNLHIYMSDADFRHYNEQHFHFQIAKTWLNVFL